MRFTLRSVGKFCVVVTASLVLSACTFQSKQLNFFKGIFEETTVIEVKPTWQLNWLNKSREMYVIQIPDAFVFTDGADLSIWFDGWNIYRIENFRDGLVIANTVYVEKETDIIESVGLRSDKIVKLRVDQGQNPLSTDPLILCAPWFGERLVNKVQVHIINRKVQFFWVGRDFLRNYPLIRALHLLSNLRQKSKFGQNGDR